MITLETPCYVLQIGQQECRRIEDSTQVAKAASVGEGTKNIDLTERDRVMHIYVPWILCSLIDSVRFSSTGLH